MRSVPRSLGSLGVLPNRCALGVQKQLGVTDTGTPVAPGGIEQVQPAASSKQLPENWVPVTVGLVPLA